MEPHNVNKWNKKTYRKLKRNGIGVALGLDRIYQNRGAIRRSIEMFVRRSKREAWETREVFKRMWYESKQ